MRKVLCIVVPALLGAPTVSAEIWKCAGKSGADVYQNFPCHLDSIGSQSSSPSTATPAPAAVRPMVAGAGSTIAAKTAPSNEPKAGMTQDEVRAIWGDPVDTIEDSPSRGRIETWQYGGGRFVQFNPKRRVMAVQR